MDFHRLYYVCITTETGNFSRRRIDIGLAARSAGPIHRCRDSCSPTPTCAFVLSSVWKWLRVEERSFSPASPEVGEDDHTCDRRVRTPQRGEGVPFKRQNNQENRQICGAEDYHCPDLRKKQRTARCDHIQQRNR